MTQQEFVKKESEKYSEKVSFQVPYNGTNDFYNEERLNTSHIDFSDGLTKGLEVAKEFAEWVSELRNANAVLRIIDKRPADELLTIFLTEKYGK